MERCPVCRARVAGKSVCRRCKSDLAGLLRLEAQADYYLQWAVCALARREIQKAGELCRYAAHLQNTPLTAALAGFIDSLSDR